MSAELAAPEPRTDGVWQEILPDWSAVGGGWAVQVRQFVPQEFSIPHVPCVATFPFPSASVHNGADGWRQLHRALAIGQKTSHGV